LIDVRRDPPLLGRFGDVDVFGAELGAEAPDPHDLRLLSGDEQARASTYELERDRAAFVARRAALRRLLGPFVGQPPEAITIDREPDGRPYVEGGPPFSVSRTSGYVLIAIRHGRNPVGIDVERVDRAIEPVELATRFFTASEADVVRSAGSTAVASETFLRLWTLKEAYLKALGRGLLGDLRDCPFELADRPRLLESNGAQWRFETFEPAPGLVAALAAKQQG